MRLSWCILLITNKWNDHEWPFHASRAISAVVELLVFVAASSLATTILNLFASLALLSIPNEERRYTFTLKENHEVTPVMYHITCAQFTNVVSRRVWHWIMFSPKVNVAQVWSPSATGTWPISIYDHCRCGTLGWRPAMSRWWVATWRRSSSAPPAKYKSHT